MNKYATISLIVFLLFIYSQIDAQFYSAGQERPSTNWRQINTEHFRLIYPDFAEEKAQFFAHKLLWAAENVPKDMGKKVRKINIIMHFESSTSNGMVIWAPRRMEVHATPDQSSYAEDWFEQLSIHEYRHVVQIDYLNQGLTKIIGYIFGEAGTSVVLGAYLPLWYLEGDAVATETALSNTGRGRMADFAMPLKAQLMDIGYYSYDKATMGSYKSYIPNHYTLGYHLVTIGKKKYGRNIWKKTEDFVARNPYYIVPFSHEIYKQSGLRKKDFYNSCMKELEQKWKPPVSTFKAETLSPPNAKYYTSFRYGELLNDSMLFALKTGIDDYSKFVLINIKTKKESKILTPGYSYFDNIEIRDSNIFWIERRYHPRWEQVKYMVVMNYNFRTHKKIQISHRTNYTFVSKNPEKEEIACINIKKNGDNSIVIISLKDNKILYEIDIKEQIKSLAYSSDGGKIYFYKLEKEGFSISALNIKTKQIIQIYKPDFKNKNHIIINDSLMFFVSDKNGNSNIFEYNIKTRTERQITNVRYGVGAISLYKDKLIFDNYTSKGWQIKSINKNDITEVKEKIINPVFYNSYISNSSKSIQNSEEENTELKTKKYKKAAHLLNIHSWGPLAIHTSNQEVNPGLSIMSQNILSDLNINIGYEYILNESVNKYFAEINYNTLFPKISLRSSYQDRKSSYINAAKNEISYSWNETTISTEISQNLNLSKGAFSNFIEIYSGLNYIYLGKNNDTPANFPANKSIQSLSYGLYAGSFYKKTKLDLYPHFGQSINIQYQHSPIGNIRLGSILATEFQLFLPGIAKHHNIRLYFGYQNKHEEKYSYSNIIKLPRGVIGISGTNISSYQLNYDLPLLYPDLSITSIAYIKRIKASIFADYAKSYNTNITTEYSSIGMDLRFDMHLLRSIAPLDLGIRTAYLPNARDYYFQFLFAVNM